MQTPPVEPPAAPRRATHRLARAAGLCAVVLSTAGACRNAHDAAARERDSERQEVRRLAEQAGRLAAGDSAAGTRGGKADTGTSVTIASGSGTGIVRGDDPPLGPGDVRVTSNDGTVVLALIGDTVRSRLGDGAMAQMRHEMAAQADTASGFGGFVARTVKGAVTGAMAEAAHFTLRVPAREVRDLRYEGGELRFRTGKNSSTSARFDRADAERFIAAVHARRQQPAGR